MPILNQNPRSIGLRVLGVPLITCALLLGIATAVSITSANAQQAPQPPKLACAPHEVMTKHLSSKLTEAPTSLGLARDGKVVELFASEDGESWTMVVTAPEGMSCIVAAGKYWQPATVKPTGPHV